jgi:ADP-ribose pyrophosphatase
MNPPTLINQKTLHSGVKFDYVELSLRNPQTGATHQRQFVRHPGAVVVVPVLDDGRLVLIRNHRAAVNQWLIELPAGTLEPGEDPVRCGARELVEETGYEAGEVKLLGQFFTSPGLSDELMRVVGARGLRLVGQKLEADECIEVSPTGVGATLEMIAAGHIADAKTIAGLMLAFQKRFVAMPAGA